MQPTGKTLSDLCFNTVVFYHFLAEQLQRKKINNFLHSFFIYCKMEKKKSIYTEFFSAVLYDNNIRIRCFWCRKQAKQGVTRFGQSII